MRPVRDAVTIVLLLHVAVAPAAGQSLADPRLQVSVWAEGLTQPTGISFIGRNDVLVAERGGSVIRMQGGERATVLQLPVNTYGMSQGLLGIAVDPGFSSNGRAYFYYTRSSTGAPSSGVRQWSGNRASALIWDSSSGEFGNEQVLLQFDADGSVHDFYHNGGPLRIGPDGRLYGVIGDMGRAQDTDRLGSAEQNNQSRADISSEAGGIFRINLDGTIPADNPFLAEGNAGLHRWYAYGVRNSFGLAFDPLTGALWDTENGPDVFDEVNRVGPGFNSGWEQVMGPIGDSRFKPNTTVQDLVALQGSYYSDPELSILPQIGITDLEFLAGSILDHAYEDALMFGEVRAGQLYLLRLNDERDGFVLSGGLADRVADNDQQLDTLAFGEGFGITTDLRVGPDGALYITSYSSGTIYRITPLLGDANRDGVVNISDLSLLAANWQQVDRSWMEGDFNGDGVVNIGDLSILAGNWQQGVSGATVSFADAMAMFDVFDGVVVPEPGTLGVLGMAGLLALRRGSKRGA